MKKRRILWLLGGICATAALGTGGWFLYGKLNEKPVSVYSVAEISADYGYWGSDMSLSGMISSDITQDVHLQEKQIVKEIFVQEGDTVQAGDPLMSYDMTLVEIELEMEKLNLESLDIKKQGILQEIEDIKRAELSFDSPVQQPVTEEIPEPETGMPVPVPQGEPVTEEGQDGQEEEAYLPELPPVTADGCYRVLDGQSRPYQGMGTAEDPYVFLCTENPVMMGSFLNWAGGFDEAGNRSLPVYHCMLELREKDVPEGMLLAQIRLDGSTLETGMVPTDGYHIRLSNQEADRDMNEEPAMDDTDTPPEEPEETFDLGELVPEETQAKGYTQEEKDKLIFEKEKEIRTIELDQKQSRLKIQEIEKKLEDQVVVSTINGTVKSVGDPQKGETDGKPFLQIISSEGLYVKGTISELLLDQIKPGQMLTGNSYESGTVFDAEITEISLYPQENGDYSGYGNANVSYYPFTAYIANGEGLKNQEYVNLQAAVQEETVSQETLYLPKMFVREDNDKSSYVWVRDGKDKLRRRQVQVGKVMYGSVVEIKEGLTLEDAVAFPYGKEIKKGAPVKDGSMEELYY